MLEEIIKTLNNYKQDVKYKEDNLIAFKSYFKEFLAKYDALNILMLLNNNLEETIDALVVLANFTDIKKTCTILEKYKPFMNKDIKYDTFLLTFIYFINDEALQGFYITAKDINYDLTIKIMTNLKEYADILETIKILWQAFNIPGLKKDLTTILKDIPTSWLTNRREFIGDINEIRDAKSKLNRNDEDIRVFYETVKRNEVSALDNITKFIYFLKTESDKKSKNLATEIRSIKKNNEKIDKLIKLLSVDGEIKNIDEILNLIPNETVKPQILDYIINHNKVYYENLLQKLEELEANTDTNLKRLFAKYNYEYEVLTKGEKEKLKTIPYLEIEKILSMLNDLEITNIEHLIPQVIINKLNIIKEFINTDTLTKSFIKANINLILDNNDLLDVLISNIKYLSDNNINIKNYHNSLNILLSQDILNNLITLKEYNLIINRKTTNINFLSDKNLLSKLDLLLEIDLNINNLDILNYSLEDIYKFKIASALNISYKEIKNISNLVSRFDKFIIPESIKELFINNDTKDTLPESLLKYKVNELILDINGVKVSINRFLRNLTNLKEKSNINIFYALIYNSFYTLEEINLISNEILESNLKLNL